MKSASVRGPSGLDFFIALPDVLLKVSRDKKIKNTSREIIYIGRDAL